MKMAVRKPNKIAETLGSMKSMLVEWVYSFLRRT